MIGLEYLNYQSESGVMRFFRVSVQSTIINNYLWYFASHRIWLLNRYHYKFISCAYSFKHIQRL